jgi:WD40 repeat protein
LTAGSDEILLLWDVETGTAIRRFEGHTYNVSSVDISPDGRHILSGSWGKELILWDFATGREVKRFAGMRYAEKAGCFSPDGEHVLSGGEDKVVRLWNIATGREVSRFEGHTNGIGYVSFCLDGKYALSGLGDQMRLWEVATGREVRRFAHGAGALLPGGRLLLEFCDKTLQLHDLQAGRVVKHILNDAGVSAAAFSSDGRYLLAGGWDKTLRLWDLENGLEITRLDGHAGRPEVVAFSPDGRHALSASGNLDGVEALWLWELDWEWDFSSKPVSEPAKPSAMSADRSNWNVIRGPDVRTPQQREVLHTLRAASCHLCRGSHDLDKTAIVKVVDASDPEHMTLEIVGVCDACASGLGDDSLIDRMYKAGFPDASAT